MSSQDPERDREPRDVATARAKWRLRFYCWSRILTLSLATATVLDGIVAVLVGRPPHAVDTLVNVVEQLRS